MRRIYELEKKLADFVEASSGNYISEDRAARKELAGMKIYESPLVGAADISDPEFEKLSSASAIGPHFTHPKKWLKDGKTVLSFFLPYTKAIKTANSRCGSEPAMEWLHGRIEGQEFLAQVCLELKHLIEHEGGRAVIPSMDARFWKTELPKGTELKEYGFTSNWSERHIGFVCGLGTFGLSGGLITKAGMAGRLGSLITDMEFQPAVRSYTKVYEYCTRCGACIRRCPAGAISLEKGKDHEPCGKFMEYTKEAYAPRYGCGKCQTGVPCESGIPYDLGYIKALQDI